MTIIINIRDAKEEYRFLRKRWKISRRKLLLKALPEPLKFLFFQ